MNINANKELETPKLQIPLNDIKESMIGIRSSIGEIRAALHRLHDTNVPEEQIIDSQSTGYEGHLGALDSHAIELHAVRDELHSLNIKLNSLI